MWFNLHVWKPRRPDVNVGLNDDDYEKFANELSYE